MIATIHRSPGQQKVGLWWDVADHSRVIIPLMVHEGIGQPLILIDVILNVLDEFVAVARDDDLGIRETLALE